MNLKQIKQAIKDGKTVYWSNGLYEVVKDSIGQYLIVCSSNQNAIGLTHKDGVTLNGRESEFFTKKVIDHSVVTPGYGGKTW